jgi:hypothetical protein
VSHVGDDTAEMMLVVARCQNKVNLAVAQCHSRPMLVTAPPSPAGDDVAESTLAMTRCRRRAMLVTVMPSPADNDTVESTLVMT